MKLFSRMLTRKPTEDEAMGKIDLDMDVEPLRRRDEPVADDTGEINPSRVKSSRTHSRAADPFGSITDRPISARAEEPEEVENAGWGDNAFAADEDWDDDEDWGEDEDLTAGLDAGGESEQRIRSRTSSAQHAAHEDHGAPKVVRRSSQAKPWTDDDQFGRRAIARSRIGSQVEGAEDRLMSETNNKFTDTESTRRRSAMAHLKRAAAATKADKVLSNVARRDPTLDPDEQSPYRDDLAKVVRPHSGSRPISRPVSKDRHLADDWDEGTSDEDAAMFAAASEQSLVADDDRDEGVDPLAHVPDNLSASDFGDEDDFEPAPRAARPSVTSGSIDDSVSPMADADDDFEDDYEDDDADGPVPSTAVSEAIAIANGEMELEDDEPEDEDDDAAVRSQIAGMGGTEKVVETTSQTPETEGFVNVATAVSAGRAGRSAGRVKTRLLGFQPGDDGQKDIFEAAKETAGPEATEFPVGWIVVTDGPGRGKCFTLFNGVSNIGRGEDQAVRLDFGDTSISRNNHAAVAYDNEQSKFFLGHGGKSNLVRLNGKPVLSTEEMSAGDEIRIGETTLTFIALCGPDFSWTGQSDTHQDDNEE